MKPLKRLIETSRMVLVISLCIIGIASILATSGDEVEEEATYTPTGNTLPTAAISSPADGAVFNEGALVTFTGSGLDAEDGTLADSELLWTSSVDGRIGIGASRRDVALSKGTHVITLTATDKNGGSASESIDITLNPRGNTLPTAAIGSPADGESFAEGHFITFSGSGTDAEDGYLSGNALIWTSSLDGQIGIGNAFTLRDLSVGNHTIRLAATDSANTMGVDSITITIGNSPPTAVISYPADGATINEGESVTFRGSGTDPEDGSLNGNALVWTSSKDGQLGVGISPTVAYLSSGSHIITLRVTDSDGATGTDGISLTVGNTIPVATIINPSDGDIFDSGDFIVFNGTGTDAEDGNLYGASLVWTSNRDGHIGTGTSFSLSTLSVGVHMITLTVTDRNGAAHNDSIDITVQ